jgi:hypothetical protein
MNSTRMRRSPRRNTFTPDVISDVFPDVIGEH